MRGSLPTAIAAELTLRLVVDGDATVAVPCVFRYVAEDPYAVHATFRTGFAEIRWTFSREILIEGMQRPSGLGDVVVWPESDGDSRLLLIALSSPTGEAVLECDLVHVEQFVQRTYDVVALGEESQRVDVDRCIDQILGEGLAGV